MSNVVVPQLGESVVEARVAKWLKQEGDPVETGEPLVELETDKIDLEVGADHSGVLSSIKHREGADVRVGDVLAVIADGEGAAAPDRKAGPGAADADAESADAEPAEAAPADDADNEPAAAAKAEQSSARARQGASSRQRAAASPAAAAAPGAAGAESAEPDGDADDDAPAASAPEARADERRRPPAEPRATPTARRVATEHAVDMQGVEGSGAGGRITKRDVTDAIQPAAPPARTERREERIRMSKRRQTIARRLVEAQRTAAMLTTFNEVDMSAVMALRARQKEPFRQRHGVGLGIASFFVKACTAALRAFPRLNAEIQGDEVVLKHYYDIGIAVGAEGGLVVPVLRDADRMSFAQIELAIRDVAARAEDGTLTLDDLTGGTFTITNGGIFGSLMSTPILNPPQVGILGLHTIQDRAVPVNGQVVIRPMMYLALSYDHRLIDGREAVQFLVRVKELIEDPGHLLLVS